METNLKHISLTLVLNSSSGPFPARTHSRRNQGGKRGAWPGSQTECSVSFLPNLESEKFFLSFFFSGVGWGVNPRELPLGHWLAPRDISVHRREKEKQGKHWTASARVWLRPLENHQIFRQGVVQAGEGRCLQNFWQRHA